jgi:hypothetical protein
MSLLNYLSACLRDLYSVSSVQTLEEAKVTRGCLYMAMPVQEVSEIAYQGYAPPIPQLTVWNTAMGQIRGDTRTGVRGSHKNTGGVGRARKASVWINRRKGCEYKEKERTECEEEHYIEKACR